MLAGYRAFCRNCLWDDGHFADESAAHAAAAFHGGTNAGHEVGIEEWPYDDDHSHSTG